MVIDVWYKSIFIMLTYLGFQLYVNYNTVKGIKKIKKQHNSWRVRALFLYAGAHYSVTKLLEPLIVKQL